MDDVRCVDQGNPLDALLMTCVTKAVVCVIMSVG